MFSFSSDVPSPMMRALDRVPRKIPSDINDFSIGSSSAGGSHLVPGAEYASTATVNAATTLQNTLSSFHLLYGGDAANLFRPHDDEENPFAEEQVLQVSGTFGTDDDDDSDDVPRVGDVSDSVEADSVNSASRLWLVPSQVATPCATSPASPRFPVETTVETGAPADSAPALWSPHVETLDVLKISNVPPHRIQELMPLICSLHGVRRVEGAGLDFTFFTDGPCGGEGFVCFATQRAAIDGVCLFEAAAKVLAERQPRMSLSVALSSVSELKAARAQYPRAPQTPSNLSTILTPAAATAIAPTPFAARAVPVISGPVALANRSSRPEPNLVYWLRGLPFQAQRADLEAFLKNIPHRRLDVGQLESGECSGNAFVELHGMNHRKELENLHNTYIPCAAHGAMASQNRPKPRFVEVMLTNPAKRQEQLDIDRATVRNNLPQHRRGRGAAAAMNAASHNNNTGAPVQRATMVQQPHFVDPTAGGAAFFAPTPSASFSGTFAHPAPQQLPPQQVFILQEAAPMSEVNLAQAAGMRTTVVQPFQPMMMPAGCAPVAYPQSFTCVMAQAAAPMQQSQTMSYFLPAAPYM